MLKPIVLTVTLSFALSAMADGTRGFTRGFDVNDQVRFAKVKTTVGFIQDSKTLVDSPALRKHAAHFKKKNDRGPASVNDSYYDSVFAIGLSSVEMNNLNVKAGDVVAVNHNGSITKAYVYRADGAYRPPEATVNLSVAAAKRLSARAGDLLEIQKDLVK